MTDLNRSSFGAPPRQRLRPWHIILIALGGLAVFGGGLYAILSIALGPMVQSGDDFMGGLRDRQFERAYALTTPALQREVGDAASMGRSIGDYRPADWSWSQRAVRNGVGSLEGAVTYGDGRSGHARLQLQRVDGQWRVEAYRLN
jgi:hypothetical protein